MFDRRVFLQRKITIPFLGAWLGRGRAAAAKPQRDFFQELRLKSFINAAEPFTALSGSLMPAEVAEAWQYAAPRYVRLEELHDAVGARIAAMIGCEAAMVTSGSRLGIDAWDRRLPDRDGSREGAAVARYHGNEE